jgi:hypothetical protein
VRRNRPDPASPVGRLLADLQALRKGTGLTRAKVARAQALCRVPVVQREAARLGRTREEVAYHLLVATVHGLKDARSRDFLITALALDHTPPGKGLTDRRRRYAADMDESRVRDREDEGLEEVARWLLEMDNPEVLFGDYMSSTATSPPAEWKLGALTEAVGVDDVHPREEVVWDFLEKTTALDEHGFGTATETRGIVRAVVDGVTGYTVHYTSNTGSQATGLLIIHGGRVGHTHPPGALGTARININFDKPLRRNATHRVHWMLDLTPAPDARPAHGFAGAPEVPVRDLTLRAQFHDLKLPLSPCYYVAQPDHLPEPYGPKRPIKLLPGNFISKAWHQPERQKVYVLAWDWPDEVPHARLASEP